VGTRLWIVVQLNSGTSPALGISDLGIAFLEKIENWRSAET
jgi:hypothetical protein